MEKNLKEYIYMKHDNDYIYICMNIYMNHFDIYPKLIQHCISTIHRFKKGKERMKERTAVNL